MSDENILRDDIYEIEVGKQTFLSIFGKHILPINRIREIDLQARSPDGGNNCVLIVMDYVEGQQYYADTQNMNKLYFNAFDADALRYFFKERKK